MNVKVTVSIIVPIYNTAAYLERCLDSILFDSSLDIEVICVNDGSQDKSLQICQDYQTKDSRIIIQCQENQGVSVSRNNGMKIARGDWIVFADSDDTMLPSYYECIANASKEYDVVIFDAIWDEKEYHNKQKKEWRGSEVRSLIPHILNSKSFTDQTNVSLRSPCAKAYRRAFLNEIEASFPEGVKIGEDMLFNISVFSHAKNMVYFPINIYQVTEREGSATHSFVSNMIESDLIFQEELKRRLHYQDLLIEYKREYYSEVKSGIMRCLRKQVFNAEAKYTYAEKKSLIQKMLNAQVYNEVLQQKDDNKKRSFILFLFTHQCVSILDFIFRYIDKD